MNDGSYIRRIHPNKPLAQAAKRQAAPPVMLWYTDPLPLSESTSTHRFYIIDSMDQEDQDNCIEEISTYTDDKMGIDEAGFETDENDFVEIQLNEEAEISSGPEVLCPCTSGSAQLVRTLYPSEPDPWIRYI
jgi:hypothetical protein